MKRYEYLYLSVFQHKTLIVTATNPDTLDWIVRVTTKSIPKCKVDEAIFSNKKWRVDIERLGSDAAAIAWWLIRELGHKGWEPIVGEYAGAHFMNMQFRLEFESDQEDNSHE